MKRKKQLIPLSREHHQSLILAKKCVEISHTKNMALISAQCHLIVQKFDETWENHFIIEEKTLFKLASQYSHSLQLLCEELVKQHHFLRKVKQQMRRGIYHNLETFGTILKIHTRTEERELFVQVEQLFNDDDLNKVFRVSSEKSSKAPKEN